jgi:ABC-type multidrug transport system fused ATPase/permease subunit
LDSNPFGEDFMAHGPIFGGRGAADDEEILGKAYDARIMSRLLGYLAPFTRQIALAFVFMVIVALANLAVPYLWKTAIDGAIAQRSLSALNWIILAYVGVGLVNWAAGFGQIYTMSWVGQRIIYNVRTQLFEHLQRLSFRYYDTHEVGRIMSRLLSDVGVLNELLTGGIIGIASDLFTLIGIVAIMMAMNPRLSLLAFAVIPLLVLATEFWRRRAREAFRLVRRTIARVNASLQENISGVRVVQSFGREDLNQQRFDEVNRSHLDANLYAARLSAVFFPSVDLIGAIATALIIWYGGTQVLGQQLTAGALVAFVLYVGRFFDPIRDLSQRYNTMQSAMAAGERIFEMVDTPVEIADAPDAVDLPTMRGEVRFEDVSFGYDGETMVLKDINLAVQPGEMVAFVGATGAGKTSMINLIGRFYDVSRGRITVDGHDLRYIQMHSLRRQLGIVLQDPFLFSGSIKENIRYGRLTATDEEIVAAAQAAQSHDFITALPQGYDTPVGERGVKLSQGQRQLISFARAILADPRLLILDEATASIDTQTEQRIQQALEYLLRNRTSPSPGLRTSFVIAHRLSTITGADKVVVIDQGRIVEMGRHEELLAQGGLYYNLYTMSFRQPDLTGLQDPSGLQTT